jgi:hypothetical protein
MYSQSFWQRWQKKFFVLFFIAQYHCHMFFLNLRYKMRRISSEEIEAQARNHWHKLCKVLATYESLTATIQTVRQGLEHEAVTATMHAVKKGLEHEAVTSRLHIARQKLEQIVFIEEAPTQPIELSAIEKLKAAGELLEHSKTAQFSLKKMQSAQHSVRKLNTPRRQKITAITLAASALLLIVLFAQSSLANHTLQTFKTFSLSAARQFSASELTTLSQEQNFTGNASKSLRRISQLDLSEYNSQSDYDTWAYSACSTASLTEVLDAYGRHYDIADVLKVESNIGAITPELGLTSDAGIASTAAQFGFQTSWNDNWTLDQVINTANAGQPVITGWPPSLYDGGHIVVVTGGDAENVYLADSSLWDRQVISRTQFLQWWAGFAAVVTPE